MSTKEEDSTTTQQQRTQTTSTANTTATTVTVTQNPTTFISLNLDFKRTQSWSTASSEFQQYEEELIPPNNFNMVSNWVYRSSFPKKKNFAFLKKLGLKSILYE